MITILHTIIRIMLSYIISLRLICTLGLKVKDNVKKINLIVSLNLLFNFYVFIQTIQKEKISEKILRKV